MATKILRPYSTYINDLPFGIFGAATAHAACDPGDDLSHDDNTSYCGTGSGSVAKSLGFHTQPNFDEQMAAVESVVFWIRLGELPSNGGSNDFKMIIRLGGAESLSITKTMAVGAYGNHSFDVTADRPGGGGWSEADFRDATFAFYFKGDPAPLCAVRMTSFWMAVEFLAAGTKIEAARRIGSRRLRLLEKTLAFIDVDVTDTKFLHRKIGDIIVMSHFAVPHASNVGAEVGIKPWQRVPYILMGRDYDPIAKSVRLSLLDAEHYWHGLWDVAKTELGYTSQRDGIATSDAGAERTFLRNSSAWVADPGDGRIIQVASHDEKNSADGHLLEQSAENRLFGSNFSEGYAARWSTQGTGLNGSAIADDTTDLFWDTGETTKSCKLTAGDPLGGTELAILQTTAQYDADTIITASTTHKDDSGEPLSILIQRAFDNWYYNAATPGWQAGAVWNDLTVRSSGERDQISNIDVGGNATTVTCKFGVKTIAGQINHIYDAQCEDTEYATSRIKTTSAAVTREDDEFYYSNTKSARTFDPRRGTAFIRVVPAWNTAELPTNSKKTVFYAEYSSTYKDHVYYDQATSAWVFVRTINGVEYEASKLATVVRGTTYDIGMRWTSAENEFDLIPAGWRGTDYDGINDYGSRSTLENEQDGDKGIASFWYRCDGNTGVTSYFLSNSGGPKFTIRHLSTDKVAIYARRPADATYVLRIRVDTVISPSPAYNHFLFGWDLSVPVAYAYLNDVSNLATVTLTIGETIDYTNGVWGFAASGGAGKITGSLSQFFCAFGEVLDFSVAANRRFFIDSNGYPVPLGDHGELPTGSQPILYAPNGNPVENRGYGGNFEPVGAPEAGDGPFVSRISIYVNGTKGTDAQCPSPSIEASTLQIGREAANLNMLDAAISHIYTTPLVVTDEAIARLP